MRLTKQQEYAATQELLAILTKNPSGRTTSELCGTPRFHGAATLSHRQIARLLRATGRVEESPYGSGCKAPTLWKLRVPPAAEGSSQGDPGDVGTPDKSGGLA